MTEKKPIQPPTPKPGPTPIQPPPKPERKVPVPGHVEPSKPWPKK